LPVDDATDVTLNPELCVTVSDPEGDDLSVTFYGREATDVVVDPFAIVVLPDTQVYAQSYRRSTTPRRSGA